MYKSQTLALKYFTASLVVFGLLVAAGLLAAVYYLNIRRATSTEKM
mgnify:CR=1 FL=1